MVSEGFCLHGFRGLRPLRPPRLVRKMWLADEAAPALDSDANTCQHEHYMADGVRILHGISRVRCETNPLFRAVDEGTDVRLIFRVWFSRNFSAPPVVQAALSPPAAGIRLDLSGHAEDGFQITLHRRDCRSLPERVTVLWRAIGIAGDFPFTGLVREFQPE